MRNRTFCSLSLEGARASISAITRCDVSCEFERSFRKQRFTFCTQFVYVNLSTMSSVLIFHFLMHNIYCNFSCCWGGRRRNRIERAVAEAAKTITEEDSWKEAETAAALAEKKKSFLWLQMSHKKDISVNFKLCTKCCANCFLFVLSSSFRQ